jgi:hypothetical protein
MVHVIREQCHAFKHTSVRSLGLGPVTSTAARRILQQA